MISCSKPKINKTYFLILGQKNFVKIEAAPVFDKEVENIFLKIVELLVVLVVPRADVN